MLLLLLLLLLVFHIFRSKINLKGANAGNAVGLDTTVLPARMRSSLALMGICMGESFGTLVLLRLNDTKGMADGMSSHTRIFSITNCGLRRNN